MTSGLFPGIHVGMSEVYPYVKEGTSVSSHTRAWCISPSVIAATSQTNFTLAENTFTTSITDTAQNFTSNTWATSAVSCVGQSSVSQVGQIQSFGDTTQTQTIDILDMLTQNGHYVPIPQTGTTLISTVGFPENTLLAPTPTTLVPSVGGFDTSPFQQGGVPVPFTQQMSEWKSLPESLHEAGKELKPLVLRS